MYAVEQFDYTFPDELIAQQPTEPRDHCRLLILDRELAQIRHQHFYNLVDLLDESTVLVRNNTRVLPARLFGHKDTGGKCEVLLIHQVSAQEGLVSWECLTKPGLRFGQTVTFSTNFSARVRADALETHQNLYTRVLDFNCTDKDFSKYLNQQGHTPLPPYIAHNVNTEAELRQSYQTTFAQHIGSVAAPTAGLHFTADLDKKLEAKGVKILEVTLHVGLGTFLPVQPEQLMHKTLHQEYFELTTEVAQQINQAKQTGKKIISVGTTTTRVLESCAQHGQVVAQSGSTQLFIQPGDRFQIIDGLITNFHVPRSSLLMLVSALVSAPNTSHPFSEFAVSAMGKAYLEAVAHRYRLFSFGDAMLIW